MPPPVATPWPELAETMVQYFVVVHQGAWMVRVEGTHYGPYPTQAAAIAAAMEATRGLTGGAQVVSQNVDLAVRPQRLT